MINEGVKAVSSLKNVSLHLKMAREEMKNVKKGDKFEDDRRKRNWKRRVL